MAVDEQDGAPAPAVAAMDIDEQDGPPAMDEKQMEAEAANQAAAARRFELTTEQFVDDQLRHPLPVDVGHGSSRRFHSTSVIIAVSGAPTITAHELPIRDTSSLDSDWWSVKVMTHMALRVKNVPYLRQFKVRVQFPKRPCVTLGLATIQNAASLDYPTYDAVPRIVQFRMQRELAPGAEWIIVQSSGLIAVYVVNVVDGKHECEHKEKDFVHKPMRAKTYTVATTSGMGSARVTVRTDPKKDGVFTAEGCAHLKDFLPEGFVFPTKNVERPEWASARK